MDWRDLLTAFALYLVLEGIGPFVNPLGFKRFMLNILKLENNILRRVAAACMLAGVVLLYFVR